MEKGQVEYLQAPVAGKEARRVVVLNYADLVNPNVRPPLPDHRVSTQTCSHLVPISRLIVK